MAQDSVDHILCPECGCSYPKHRWDCKIGAGWVKPPINPVAIGPERYGLAPATAAKYGKLKVWEGLLARFPRALKEVARVSEFGAKKHEVDPSDMSYLDVPDAYGTYTNGVGRHLLGEALEGVVNLDPKDGRMLHPAQLVWNALARLEVYLRDKEGKTTLGA